MTVEVRPRANCTRRCSAVRPCAADAGRQNAGTLVSSSARASRHLSVDLMSIFLSLRANMSAPACSSRLGGWQSLRRVAPGGGEMDEAFGGVNSVGDAHDGLA